MVALAPPGADNNDTQMQWPGGTMPQLSELDVIRVEFGSNYTRGAINMTGKLAIGIAASEEQEVWTVEDADPVCPIIYGFLASRKGAVIQEWPAQHYPRLRGGTQYSNLGDAIRVPDLHEGLDTSPEEFIERELLEGGGKFSRFSLIGRQQVEEILETLGGLYSKRKIADDETLLEGKKYILGVLARAVIRRVVEI
jgi:hypothetical protein